MRVVLICEGQTEEAFKSILASYLKRKNEAAGIAIPRIGIDAYPTRGPLRPTEKLKRDVSRHLGSNDVKAVITLPDVYPQFNSPQQARDSFRTLIGDEFRFFPHVACLEFEAWLLPYWSKIIQRIGVNAAPFGADPERVNHHKPPSHRLKELYSRANPKPRAFVKPTEAFAILKGEDLEISARACPELRAFLNTILSLAELPLIQ